MTKSNRRSVILVSVILLLTLLYSCDFDQIENYYSDFSEANKDGFFNNGWIPPNLVFNSMTDIYQRTNIDLNTCIFNYNLSKKDLIELKEKVEPISARFNKLHRVQTSGDWVKSVNKLKHYFNVGVGKSDTVFIAIDEINNKIYGWAQ
jgi:hypothetical protein